MSKVWWGIVGVSFAIGAILIGIGFWLFDSRSFLESIVAESIGLAFAFGVAVWLIEGPVLTREKRLRRVIEYKWKVFQRVWDIGSLLAKDIAEPIAADFEDRIDLHGDERGRWEAFEPLLRGVFKQARQVPETGLPSYPSLDEASVNSTFESCLSMVKGIRQVIDSDPGMENQVSRLIINLHGIEQEIERAKRLGLIHNQVTSYEVIGALGDRILDIIDTITELPEGTRPNS